MVKVNLKICAALMLCFAGLAPAAGADTLPASAPDDIRLELSRAHAGDVESMYRVATYLADEAATDDDAMASFAFGWALLAARNGHAQAAELTGVMYRGGTGVPQNYVKARKWLERALARRSMEPNFELAILYADEDNPGMDKIKSAKHLTEAIRTSEPRACLIAARNKIDEGVELRRILGEITCAAEGGIPEAMEMIADYQLSKRSPQSKIRAREWLMRAVNSGSETAAGKLAALDNN